MHLRCGSKADLVVSPICVEFRLPIACQARFEAMLRAAESMSEICFTKRMKNYEAELAAAVRQLVASRDFGLGWAKKTRRVRPGSSLRHLTVGNISVAAFALRAVATLRPVLRAVRATLRPVLRAVRATLRPVLRAGRAVLRGSACRLASRLADSTRHLTSSLADSACCLARGAFCRRHGSSSDSV